MKQVIDLRVPVIDLRKVEVGTEVISSKGFSFILVSREKGKESWLDVATGITWGDTEYEKYTWDDAVAEFKDALPTRNEFKLAREHGAWKVVPSADSWYWSSTEDGNYGAWIENIPGGTQYGYTKYYAGYVRCVVRRSVI